MNFEIGDIVTTRGFSYSDILFRVTAHGVDDGEFTLLRVIYVGSMKDKGWRVGSTYKVGRDALLAPNAMRVLAMAISDEIDLSA